jgi:hypothetical protein
LSSLEARLKAQGVGPVAAKIGLRRAKGEAWLVATAEGAFVALGAGTAGPLALVPVREEPPALSARLLGAVLEVRGEAMEVPAGKLDDVTRLLARARIAPAGEPRADLRTGRYVPRLDELATRFLTVFLEDDEPLLAWLETASSIEVPSPVAVRRAPVFLLVTSHRQALVALSSVGDVLVRPLPAAAAVRERKVLFSGGLFWQLPLGGERPLLEAAGWPALAPAERVLEAARRGLTQGGKRDPAAQQHLAWLVRRKAPFGTLAAHFLGAGLGLKERPGEGARDEALARLVEEHDSSVPLLVWWRAFGVGLAGGRELLAALAALGGRARAWSLGLHAGLREALLDAAEDGFEEAAIDVAYAAHLLELGHKDEALVVLEARLLALPSEELLDLLPAEDQDPARRGQRARVRVLELLTEARGGSEAHAGTLHELALLEPLVPSRLRAMHDAVEGPLKEAARQALAVLEPGGLSPLDPAAPPSPDGEVFPLRKRLLHERLRHPAAREGHVLEKLQTLLASIDAPDHAALRSYGEWLGQEHQAAWMALADASVALGMKSVGAFVSRGDKAVGIRAYEGSPSFLVLGGRHLEPASAFYLHPWELRFSIAAELCHLRFGHTRVTTRDVWLGALHKSRIGVDLMLGMIPVLKGVKLIDRIEKILERYKKGPVGRVMKGLDLAERTVNRVRGTSAPKRPPKEQLVAAPHDKLIAAHRVMQLSADRAGLLLAGDLGAAIRAIFKESHEGLSELPVAERHGVAKALARRADDGEPMHRELALRVSSLISFFLSHEHQLLREALLVRSHRH